MQYVKNLNSFSRVKICDDFDKKKKIAPWLFTIFVSERRELEKKLRANKIESGQTHYRNDRYSIFKSKNIYKNMDRVESKYLVLPLHTKMTISDVDKICSIIKSGW